MSLTHEFANPNYNFSAFQKEFIAKNELTADFGHWVYNDLGNQVREPSWICMLWFTDAGELTAQRVGLNRILGDKITA